MTPEEMRAHAEALVVDWPDLTGEQVERLRAILRPVLLACVNGCQHIGGPGHHGACVKRP